MEYIERQEAFRTHHQASGQERLAMLAAYLDTLPPHRLTLGFWFRNRRGCAVGLAAAMDPWFQAQGLRLKDIDRPVLCRPVYQDKSDWEAVAAFFGLGFGECRELFSAEAYQGTLQPLPTSIAERIRRYLSAHGVAPPAAEGLFSSEIMDEAAIS